ncbi:sialate O-acetylesterase [Brevundimonas sp. UBA7534]|uniref:sialate O-acetylesterase n=1 Tax=Brevundimonas sp. UBA7534 TaxID=1946138 RepID=UPI0025BF0DB2|nr:sialate O-acetylesterase [Brevundimonas sp. UBA7534]
MRHLLLAAVSLTSLFAGPVLAQPSALLDPMFQDHAVLQRERAVPVWGRATPGQTVTVALGANTAQAVADAQGRWRADLPALTAGGPYVLEARSGGVTQSVSDVMVGDVWLCSGQSNMEFEVRKVANTETEVAAANDPNLRLFLVARSSLPAPSDDPGTVGRWAPTTPASVRDFSAACYFMGRDLRRAEDLPVGLISASWGGSVIEDWLTRPTLAANEPYRQGLDALAAYARSPEDGEAAWKTVTTNWWAAHDPGTQRGWNRPELNDADWAPIPSEGFWEATVPGLETFDGIVWLRAEVTLSAAQARQAATINLGPVDDADATWVNGRFVGGQQGWDTPRTYAIPAGTLKAGRNVMAVGVLDTNGGGGAWGPASDKAIRFADGSSVQLTGWKHKVAAPLTDLPNPPRTPWIGGSGLTTLYNGMIDPLGPYGLKGMAWYQGESNVGDPAGYRRLLADLFADWRARFENPEMRMLVVQLANFGPMTAGPSDSAWAALRESQRVVTNADPLAGLAVAIDIGDRYDIHPTNKQEVGRRLALEALRLDGRVEPVSPQPQTARRSAEGVRIRYAAPLTAYGAGGPVGFELCGAEGACRFVEARLDGVDVVLAGARPEDVKARFCWADSPVCNLYGPAGLPAVPFEMTVD